MNKIEINLSTQNQMGEIIKILKYINSNIEFLKKQKDQIISDNYPKKSVGELLIKYMLSSIETGSFVNLIQIDDIKYIDYDDIPAEILLKPRNNYKREYKSLIICTQDYYERKYFYTEGDN